VNNKLTDLINKMIKQEYYLDVKTYGEFCSKRILEEFIQNSGMPLGYKTIQDSTGLTNCKLNKQLDKLKAEGYIEQIDSPASFLFKGTDGQSYQLALTDYAEKGTIE